MITKRRCQVQQSRSRERKNPRQSKQQKKSKKDEIQKFRGCSSKKRIKIITDIKQSNDINPYHNQNENKINIPLPNIIKIKHIHRYKDEQLGLQYNNNEIKRSNSTGNFKLIKQNRKSLSPITSKQFYHKQDIKFKYSSKGTSRSEKQKNKQHHYCMENAKYYKKIQQDKNKIFIKKKSDKIIKNTIQRFKTQNSSKYNQNKQPTKKLQKQTKNKQKKQVKPKTTPKLLPPQKIKTKSSKIKQKLKNSIIFSQQPLQHNISPIFSAIQTKQNFHVKFNLSSSLKQHRQIDACIIIQKYFRGYLTRKYIAQFKYQIYCIIKIQKVWRGYSWRKKIKKQQILNKKLSIQNSLSKIKDFAQQPKQQKSRAKSFTFNFTQIKSQENNSTSTNKKPTNELQQKYIQILQTLLKQQCLDEKFKQKIRKTLGKQKYVQNKIISQIISQKSFNSPRELRSPKNHVSNSPNSWSKGKSNQVIYDSCVSPRNNQFGQSLSKRINSPLQNKSASKSSCKRIISQIKQQIKLDIKPIQTSFDFIEQFQLIIVDYLRDNPEIKQLFLEACKKCQNFKTDFIFGEYRIQKFSKKSNFNFLYTSFYPDIFPNSLRQDIINENSMKIYLEERNYHSILWRSNQTQQQICQSYIKCIFDGLSEAVYENYKNEVVTKRVRSSICLFQGHQLFKIIFMNSLTLMQGWNEYMCGAEIPVGEGDINYKNYYEKNLQRLEIMVKNDVKGGMDNCHKFWMLWAVLCLSQQVFQGIVQELCYSFFI